MPSMTLLSGGSSGTSLLQHSTNSVTFAAANTGSIATHNIFNVTGQVLVCTITGFVLSDLTADADLNPTISLGATGKLTIFIGNTTVATAGTSNMTAALGIWVSTTPTAGALALPNAVSSNGTIVMADYLTYTILTQEITGGSLRVDVFWMALSSDGNVAAMTVT